MRRHPVQLAGLVALLAGWAACFALALGSALRGTAFSPVYVAAAAEPDGAPVLTGFRAWLPGDRAGLEPGDRLLRIGDADLAGVGPFGLWVRVAAQDAPDGRLPVVYERDGRVVEGSLTVGLHGRFWTYLVVSASFAALGVWLALRAPPSRAVDAFLLGALVIAFNYASNFGGSVGRASVSLAVHLGSMALLGPLTLRALQRFPDDVRPLDGLRRYGPWVFVAIAFFEASLVYGAFLPPRLGGLGFMALAVLVLAALLATATHKFRTADPVGRRQLKWFLYGLYLALLPSLATAFVSAGNPASVPLYLASQLSFALVPLFLLVAIARFNLFDVDRVISTTASYNVLAVLLLAAVLTVVPRIAEATSELLGMGFAGSELALSLLLASLLVPANRLLRPWIERIFFSQRHAFDTGIDDLLEDLSSFENPRQLAQRTGERLNALLRPETCVVYGGGEQGFAPVFVMGRAVPPAFPSDSPLVSTLRTRREPLALHTRGRARGSAARRMGAFERAALETLGAELVIPVRRGDALLAFLCLGPRRSGDVYTPTDLALLSAVADKVSTELMRFDTAEIAREGRAMSDALKRYVPGAIVAQLELGHELRPEEREVSVLFVDIRGHSRISEGRAAEEVFSTLNRYTEVVSRIVREHEGTVVEFNGDGMMAVFGAPQELPERERRAIAAAREIYAAVRSLRVDPGDEGSEALDAGVGVASGPAFVGNIRSADRLIWSAVGNTTNRAARLQALTRELDAAVVIDAATWQAASAAADDFSACPQTPIRGLTRPADLYVLGSGGAPPAASWPLAR